jgi:hypothetical protein
MSRKKRSDKKRTNAVQYAIIAVALIACIAIIGIFVIRPMFQHRHTPKNHTVHRHWGKGPRIETNKKSYYGREPIVVRFFNTDGKKGEWISIADEGSPARLFWKYSFTGGRRNGTMVFRSLDLKPGIYEARLHYSWSTRSYTVRKRCYFKVR